MIVAIDHVVIAVRDIEAARRSYQLLLARAASATQTEGGVATAIIPTANVAVEVMAPAGESEGARRLRIALDDGGEGLKSLVFATDDIEQAHRKAERVGLEPEGILARGGRRSFRLATPRTRGVRLFCIERSAPAIAGLAEESGVQGLDHVVVRSGDCEAAAALYGARLGLDMRLDREVAGRRLLFFRCGDAVVEIAHAQDMSPERDALWGLSWRVRDADLARARLHAAGLSVSEVRKGFKSGTRVFTVRDGSCGVPTLMLETAPRSD